MKGLGPVRKVDDIRTFEGEGEACDGGEEDWVKRNRGVDWVNRKREEDDAFHTDLFESMAQMHDRIIVGHS